MTTTEQAGNIVGSIVDGLKSSPSCLAAIVMAGIFASMVFFSAKERDRQFHERNLAMLQACFSSPAQQAHRGGPR